ncbi:TIGR03089 family protein [Ornithinimicrobium sp. F0845]|uniref:TIGR03089 family protein n=1 Tax=Ornithinimicrobium sp. F0845 TaxID=2926412 RepID=UPI001FF4021D|nr:TIGR03089 family protein [Ornithinimicrobium sp. F0845]
MLTPHQALTDLVHDDATRPAITFYDDTPGPTQGERIEISRRVLDNWVAKAANALQEGLDVQRGSVVLLDLPSPHWRTCYWALAVWAVGATLTLDAHEGADVLVTTDPDSGTAEDADEVVAVTLAALAREYAGDLRSGVMDEAKEMSSFGDGFTPWDEPEEDDDALVHDGDRTTYGELFGGPASDDPGWPAGSRVLVTSDTAYDLIRHLLRALATGSSLVLVRGSGPADEDRLASEGVTLRT